MEHINLKGEFNVRIKYFLIMLFITLQINAQNSKVPWSSFNMGFAESKTGNTNVKSVAGQNFVGTSQLVNTQVLSGFLADTLFRARLVAVNDIMELPKTFALYQNYPNPFNPSTTIKYDLPTSEHVVIKVYNLLGQDVVTLLDEVQEPGYKLIRVDARNLASGVYFYKLDVGEFVAVKKFILIK
jgi:hypothetical protein